jgi:predicted 3-demethylubiquinone-9 3-methyltransferase (glyoxalase superfamily)
MAARQKIKTFLWYEANALEAARFYVSIFKNSKILEVARYGEAGPGEKGSVMTVLFQLEGQRFIALNGGPHFQFNEAISLAVDCDTQKEIDTLWKKLTSGGGQESQCGWLKDKFGLSWQINPTVLSKMFADKDPQKVKRAMQAMLQMKKMDIAALKRAFAGK